MERELLSLATKPRLDRDRGGGVELLHAVVQPNDRSALRLDCTDLTPQRGADARRGWWTALLTARPQVPGDAIQVRPALASDEPEAVTVRSSDPRQHGLVPCQRGVRSGALRVVRPVDLRKRVGRLDYVRGPSHGSTCSRSCS